MNEKVFCKVRGHATAKKEKCVFCFMPLYTKSFCDQLYSSLFLKPIVNYRFQLNRGE